MTAVADFASTGSHSTSTFGASDDHPLRDIRNHSRKRRRHDRELSLTRGWIEIRRRGDDALDAAQQRADVLDQGQGERARLHPAANLDQQRVTNLLAQSRQGVADRRLGPPEPFRRQGDAAQIHQGFESDQEIQVDTGEINFVHGV